MKYLTPYPTFFRLSKRNIGLFSLAMFAFIPSSMSALPTSVADDYTGELEVIVDLQAGDNTIRLWRDGAGIDALRVDWLQLNN